MIVTRKVSIRLNKTTEKLTKNSTFSFAALEYLKLSHKLHKQLLAKLSYVEFETSENHQLSFTDTLQK